MIREGREFSHSLELECDAVVVGSGCGGAVVAKILSEAGLSVIVLEEGGYYPQEKYGQFTPADSLRYMYRDFGGTPAIGLGDTPLILIQAGRCVGGSSVVNGGVCFRTPPEVIQKWRTQLGLTSFTQEHMERIFEEIERELQVQPVPEQLHNRGVLKLREAAKKKGYSSLTLRRNVVHCDTSCRCIFGCPKDRKQSVLVTYLRKAQDKGAQIYADFQVKRVVLRKNRVLGVEGHILERYSGFPLFPFFVRAKLVVLAAGSLGTPLILQKSRVRLKAIGRNLTLHPGARVYGIFEEPIYGWRGAFQSYCIDHFAKEGFKLISIFPPLGVISATLPGFGKTNQEHLKLLPYLSAFGVMISDESHGRVRTFFGKPLITYRMLPRDKAKLLKGIYTLAELYFEAGAKRVYLPFQTHPFVDSLEELRKIDFEKIRAKWIECGSQHPLGSCRMGSSPKTSVVNEYGACHAVPNLFIADGSAIPTSVAVNPQITVMAIAAKVSEHILEFWNSKDKLLAKMKG